MNKTHNLKDLQSSSSRPAETSKDKILTSLNQNENLYITTAGGFTVKTSYAGSREISEVLTDWLLSA